MMGFVCYEAEAEVAVRALCERVWMRDPKREGCLYTVFCGTYWPLFIFVVRGTDRRVEYFDES